VRVTLDEVADDGPPGENDNVHGDVKDIEATNFDDVIVGSAASNVIDTFGGNDVIDGGGGVDTIRAGDGNDSVMSRDGLEEIIDCGAGIDFLVADDIDRTDGCETEQRCAALQTDLDGDGAARPLDCHDLDPAIHPGARDVPDDGIDQDCDSADATDRDRDGFPRPVD
jgi:hypothetical protein